ELPARLRGMAGATQLRREVIEGAVQQLRFVEDNVPLDRGMLYSMAVAYRDLAHVQGGSAAGSEGDRDKAVVSMASARTYLDQLLGEHPEDTAALQLLAEVEIEWGGIIFAIAVDV